MPVLKQVLPVPIQDKRKKLFRVSPSKAFICSPFITMTTRLCHPSHQYQFYYQPPCRKNGHTTNLLCASVMDFHQVNRIRHHSSAFSVSIQSYGSCIAASISAGWRTNSRASDNRFSGMMMRPKACARSSRQIQYLVRNSVLDSALAENP